VVQRTARLVPRLAAISWQHSDGRQRRHQRRAERQRHDGSVDCAASEPHGGSGGGGGAGNNGGTGGTGGLAASTAAAAAAAAAEQHSGLAAMHAWDLCGRHEDLKMDGNGKTGWEELIKALEKASKEIFKSDKPATSAEEQ